MADVLSRLTAALWSHLGLPGEPGENPLLRIDGVGVAFAPTRDMRRVLARARIGALSPAAAERERQVRALLRDNYRHLLGCPAWVGTDAQGAVRAEAVLDPARPVAAVAADIAWVADRARALVPVLRRETATRAGRQSGASHEDLLILKP
ncbi:CesT family type III secretion system chaperone [Alsobacter sp. SYSU M60028]|uniref:CesT family type III secretion system chaperone n=1 Tax=Alsobacter ponti TaxID=2962936 RepID=A0ABT1LDE2_9HYPH|nr:CesT family type III secretion system chaperone [Alsobacter ponti]MCP8939517.1 CesT family type III secretion system chaperone [Alsobacter ponti]